MNEDQSGTDPRVDQERNIPVGSRHRGPRMVPFLLSGAFLGALVGVIVDMVGPASGVATAGQEFIVLGGAGALLGASLGAVIYLIAEWISLRRT